jgi:hypothetical protein
MSAVFEQGAREDERGKERLTDALAKGSASAAWWKSRYSRSRAMPLAVEKRQNEANSRTRIRERFGLIHEHATSIASNFIAAPFGSQSSTNHLVSQPERKRGGAGGIGPAAPFGEEMRVCLTRLF